MLDGKAFGAEMTAIVKDYVARETAPLLQRIAALEARPAPERGEKGEPGERGEAGAPGEPGRDGVGVRDGFLQRDGVLILTLTDGTTRELGTVIGKDGADGADGKDGEPGKDGADGFGLDEFDVEPVDERTIKLAFTRGDTKHSFELQFPVIIDRGVFKAGDTYARGDAVTWGGSLWIAQKETDAKPDGPDSGWRLAVKKGRDGKDAK